MFPSGLSISQTGAVSAEADAIAANPSHDRIKFFITGFSVIFKGRYFIGRIYFRELSGKIF